MRLSRTGGSLLGLLSLSVVLILVYMIVDGRFATLDFVCSSYSAKRGKSPFFSVRLCNFVPHKIAVISTPQHFCESGKLRLYKKENDVVWWFHSKIKYENRS
jgi:hypothetical protein